MSEKVTSRYVSSDAKAMSGEVWVMWAATIKMQAVRVIGRDNAR
jgi:hypothetical protein